MRNRLIEIVVEYASHVLDVPPDLLLNVPLQPRGGDGHFVHGHVVHGMRKLGDGQLVEQAVSYAAGSHNAAHYNKTSISK